MIKVEPFSDPEYFYTEGDVVIGRCHNHLPWPGVIRAFFGYDQDEVQVYTVDFFDEKSYAYLETYLITPLSDHVIKKMRTKYRLHRGIMKALVKAEKALKDLKIAVAGDPKREERFQRMYHPEVELNCGIFEDVQTFSKQALEPRNLQNVELMPKIQQYYVDKTGSKKKSKEFVKRKLSMVHSTINLSVQIAPHDPKNTKQLATIIQEGSVMSHTIGQRIFEKQPLRQRTADELQTVNQQALEDLREENDQKRDLELEGNNKDEDENLKIIRTTRLIS